MGVPYSGGLIPSFHTAHLIQNDLVNRYFKIGTTHALHARRERRKTSKDGLSRVRVLQIMPEMDFPRRPRRPNRQSTLFMPRVYGADTWTCPAFQAVQAVDVPIAFSSGDDVLLLQSGARWAARVNNEQRGHPALCFPPPPARHIPLLSVNPPSTKLYVLYL